MYMAAQIGMRGKIRRYVGAAAAWLLAGMEEWPDKLW